MRAMIRCQRIGFGILGDRAAVVFSQAEAIGAFAKRASDAASARA
jgi:hypothetical protein